MKTGVYLCTCGGNLAERIDFDSLKADLENHPDVARVKIVDFLCAEEGQQFLETDLAGESVDRVVIAACSPREYERTFMQVLARSGMNPYLLQMVNIREHVAWVTPDGAQATAKAGHQIRAAIARVLLQEPLERKELEICRDAVVIGAGPAGLKCALALAEAGRHVVLVEKSPVLGGMPVRYLDLFPNMECGPCMLEPVIGDVLHGPHAANIEILTMAEVSEVTGYSGNFSVRIQQAAQCVDAEACVGCGLCVPPCPVSVTNGFNCGLDQRKAIGFAFPGALPNAPFLDASACLRATGEDCTLCQAACPVEGAIRYDAVARSFERNAGAIVVAVGFGLFDCRNLPQLGYGTVPGVYTSLEFERILATNGPTAGQLRSMNGDKPRSVAILHCVGSLEDEHQPYCSGVCCEYAFKFNRLIEKKAPGTRVIHLYKELVMPGKEDFALYRQARGNPDAVFLRYGGLNTLRVVARNGAAAIEYQDPAGEVGSVDADMIVLCPAMVGPEAPADLSAALETPLDRFGFFEEWHSRLDSAKSKMKGVYLAGCCQAPMDIQKSISQGMAAAGYALSGLAEGRKLEIEPATAMVIEERCALCRSCGAVCPYKAISYPAGRKSAQVNPLLCQGCGTCVAACPAGAIHGNHFTDEQILSEIEAILQ